MKTKTIFKVEIISFIIGTIVFLLIPFLITPNIGSYANILGTDHFKRFFVENLLLVAFFFFNYFWLIPNLYFKKKYVIYGLVLLVFFFLLYQVSEWIFPFREHFQDGFQMRDRRPPNPRREPGMPMPPFRNWSPKLLMYICTVLIALFLRHNKRFQQMKTEKQSSEISYLRAQINPHFLFNTLNNLYALTLTKSDLAPDAVLKLSQIMRYIVSESSNEKVLLQKELNYIKNYIDLQLFRFNQESVQYTVKGSANQLEIVPLILIPFIENTFKYGVVNDVEFPIKINININENILLLTTENYKSNEEVPDAEKTEIGISNTKKRLNYFYPNRHDLNIKENHDTFVLELKIVLDAENNRS